MLSFKEFKQQKQLIESVEINPIKALEEVILDRHPEVEKLHLQPRDSHDIKLDTLIIKKEHRNTGVGSKVLHDLKTYADKHGKRIILTAGVRDKHWGTTSQSRLDNFYRRNGFVANKGRNKDFTIMATHYYAGRGHISESIDHPMIEVDGVMKHRHNSLGQPIHPTDEGIRNFHRWFGDSSVVDEHRRPLVVYHGTVADFESFDNSKTGSNDLGLWGKGHYFSTNTENANSYALRQGDGAQILPTYVSLKTPLILRTSKDLITRLPDGTNYRDLLGNNLDGSKIKSIAKSGNHDGVIQIKPDGKIGDLVAYDSSQIKSAIGNSGKFAHKTKLNESEDYMGRHTAPTEEDAPAHDLTKIMPEDVYSTKASRHYSTGFSDSEDRYIFAKLRSIRNNPSASVTIYRAIPKSETRDSAITKLEKHKAGILKTGRFPSDVDSSNFSSPSDYYDWAYNQIIKLKQFPPEENIKKTINKGDWVTLSRAYAKGHGDAHLAGQYRILSKSVRADEVFTNGDSIHEWGYHPKAAK
jgi:hypothetical protein